MKLFRIFDIFDNPIKLFISVYNLDFCNTKEQWYKMKQRDKTTFKECWFPLIYFIGVKLNNANDKSSKHGWINEVIQFLINISP